MNFPLRTEDGVAVATVTNEGELFKRAVESRHMMRVPEGWAFDRSIIEKALYLNADRIKIEATDTGTTYRVGINRFLAKAIPIDRGHNKQLLLPIRFWSVNLRNLDKQLAFWQTGNP